MVRTTPGFDIAHTLATNPEFVTGMENQPLQFLLIMRRDSLGFIELIRGRYKVHDVDYIRLHLGGITEDEQKRYKEGPFDVLCNSM